MCKIYKFFAELSVSFVVRQLTCISRCHDGHCMRETWRCDGVKDCADGSDEIDCGNIFRYINGGGILRDYVRLLCLSSIYRMPIMLADNATISASKCKLENDLFLCPNQRCISLLKTCDGQDNCGDGHDENGSCSNGTYFDISIISQAVFDCRFFFRFICLLLIFSFLQHFKR
jgi:hypothetical protein